MFGVYALGSLLLRGKVGWKLEPTEKLSDDVLIPLVNNAANTYGIPPDIFYGLVMQESSGIWNAHREEPGFYRRYLKGRSKERLGGVWPKSPIGQMRERSARAWSWGLTQIMLQTAREHGFKEGPEELLIPKINLNLGARILAHKIRRRGGDITKGLLAYNGGGDPNYPDKVKKKAKGYVRKATNQG